MPAEKNCSECYIQFNTLYRIRHLQQHYAKKEQVFAFVEKSKVLDGLSDDERKSMLRLMNLSVEKWVSDVDREKFRNTKSFNEAQKTCKINWVMAMEEFKLQYEAKNSY